MAWNHDPPSTSVSVATVHLFHEVFGANQAARGAPARPWCMYMVHVHGVCTWCMYMVHVHGARTWCTYMVHVHAPCTVRGTTRRASASQDAGNCQKAANPVPRRYASSDASFTC